MFPFEIQKLDIWKLSKKVTEPNLNFFINVFTFQNSVGLNINFLINVSTGNLKTFLKIVQKSDKIKFEFFYKCFPGNLKIFQNSVRLNINFLINVFIGDSIGNLIFGNFSKQ